MAKVSDFTKVVQNLAAEAKTVRERATRAPAVPLMQEKVSNREARARIPHLTPQALLGMTPEGRADLIKAVGSQAVLDIVRKAGGGSG